MTKGSPHARVPPSVELVVYTVCQSSRIPQGAKAKDVPFRWTFLPRSTREKEGGGDKQTTAPRRAAWAGRLRTFGSVEFGVSPAGLPSQAAGHGRFLSKGRGRVCGHQATRQADSLTQL